MIFSICDAPKCSVIVFEILCEKCRIIVHFRITLAIRESGNFWRAKRNKSRRYRTQCGTSLGYHQFLVSIIRNNNYLKYNWLGTRIGNCASFCNSSMLTSRNLMYSYILSLLNSYSFSDQSYYWQINNNSTISIVGIILSSFSFWKFYQVQEKKIDDLTGTEEVITEW